MLLTLGFAIIEAIGGWYTGSLALFGDAGHMFSDSAALALASLGAWMASKPASQRHSYGLMRSEVIVAFLNGLFMLIVVIAIVYEAIQRIQAPQPVQGAEVMLIAIVGLVINLIVARKLHQHQTSINHRAAFLHVMGDLLGSIAAIVAGAVIYFSGWLLIDPILSILISVLIFISTIRLLREALQVLMEGVPAHIDLQEVTHALSHLPNVHEVHSLHVWALSSEVTALSAHIVLADMQAWHPVLKDVRHLLHEKFNIGHITLQPESIDALNQGEVGCWLTHKEDASAHHHQRHLHKH
ncbi:cation transporter [Methylovorus sp. MM2]|nr:cation transporter [Methylovorus sp. MM2]